MLKHLGEEEKAARLEKAVAKIIKEGKFVTYDMKAHRNDPTAVGTREMGEAIIAEMLNTTTHRGLKDSQARYKNEQLAKK